jgi:hypothetical protein
MRDIPESAEVRSIDHEEQRCLPYRGTPNTPSPLLLYWFSPKRAPIAQAAIKTTTSTTPIYQLTFLPEEIGSSNIPV